MHNNYVMIKMKGYGSDLKTRIKNFFFCQKYPFWKVRSVFNDRKIFYIYTKYDSIPVGWRKMFGKQLCEDLKNALIEDGNLKTFRIKKVHLVNGELVIEEQNSNIGTKTKEVLEKYRKLSKKFCTKCGNKATLVTPEEYVVERMCSNCFEKKLTRFKLTESEIAELSKNCKIYGRKSKSKS